ncbi:MAG: sulfatase [Planctomycetota bacterium]
MRIGRTLFGLTICLAAIYLFWRFGQDPGEAGREVSRLPPVILVSLDTVRADVAGCYGSQHSATPRLDELATQAILFEEATTPEPQTLPAHVSLFTGLCPTTHGVLPSREHRRRLEPAVKTLAEILEDRGYRTGAFVNVNWLSPIYGIDTGFTRYDLFPNDRENLENPATRFGRSAEETNACALDWVDEDPGKPFFLFVHYFDAHSDIDRRPYDAPPDYVRRFAPGYDESFACADGEVAASSYLSRVNETNTRLSPEHLAVMRGLYEAGVAYTDAQLGRLVDALRERDLFDRALVVVVADHGEEFQEHGRTMHTQLHEECLRVPFLIKLPAGKKAGTRVKGLVSLIDLLPTVLERLGIDEELQLDGKSLWPLVEGAAGHHDELLLNYDLGQRIGLRTERLKLITHAQYDIALLFDLVADPGEKLDLARERPDVAARMRRRLLDLLGNLERRWSAERVRLDPDQERALDSLGYTSKGK